MAQFKKPSKKATIITAAIIIVLLIIAVTGTVVFLKDRGTTEAADLASEQVTSDAGNEETTTEETATQSEEGTEIQADEETSTPQDTENEGVAEGTETGTQATTGTTTTGGTTTSSTENIQETTITRVETVETITPWENQDLGWSQKGVDADFANAGLSTLDVQEDDVQVEKMAETKSGEGLVQAGEKITYKITVTNNSAKDVEVKDKIPAQTTYVENSADNGAEEVKEAGNVVGLVWNVEAGKTVVLSFKVTVNAGATGMISNIAVANGEESEPTETAVIELTKTSYVTTTEGEKLEGKDKVAKVGDEITYTVSVKNTGDESKTVKVKDSKLSELISKGILEIKEDSKETAGKLMAGTDVTVSAGETVELTFTTKVLKVEGTIVNVVTSGDNDSENPEDPSTTDTVETKGLLVEKIVDDKPESGDKYKFGETVTFKVTVKNTGSTTLENVKVTDELEEAKLVEGKTPIKELKSGDSVTLTYEYKVQEADVVAGHFKNIATATSDGVTEQGESEDVSVEQEYAYTVEYYYDGIINPDNTERYTATFNDVIEDYDGKNITGYKLEKTENLPLTISGVEENNVIKVYYVKDFSQTNKLEYTVNHITVTTEGENTVKTDKYEENVYVLDEQKITVKEDTVDALDAKDPLILGYKLDETRIPEVKAGDKVENGTVVNLYYVKDASQTHKLSYTVEYYKDGVKADTEKVEKEVWINDTTLPVDVSAINVTDKYDGYVFEKTNLATIPATIENGGIIKVYYVPVDVTLTKTAVDRWGNEVETLYLYNEGDTVYYDITVKNNSKTLNVNRYIVTDTLPQELRYVTQSDASKGYVVEGDKLTWTIEDLAPQQTKTIRIETVIKNDSWSAESPIIDRIDEVTEGTGTPMTAREYNERRWTWGGYEYVNRDKYDNDDSYYNCSFHIYNSKNGEIPYEDGTTQYTGGYTSIGFGRVSGTDFNTELSSVDDINSVIDTHNEIEDKIVYAPVYNPGEGKVVLWYVSKTVTETEETIGGVKAYVKYHVDGVVVDLQYAVTNQVVGSDGTTASDTVLARDNSANPFSMAKARIVDYSIEESDIDVLAAEMEAQEAEEMTKEEQEDTEATKQENNSTENTIPVEETKPEQQPGEEEQENTSQEEVKDETSQGANVEEDSSTTNTQVNETQSDDEAVKTKVTEQEKPIVVNNIETSN